MPRLLLGLYFGTWVVGLFRSEVVASAQTIKLEGHVPAIVSKLVPLVQMPATNRLQLAIGLPLRNSEQLEGFLEQLQNPASSNYHKYLTPPQFTERFGPTPQQYDSVITFARNHGLTITGRHSNRVVLDVEGSVSNIERAFQITLSLYHHPNEARDFFAPNQEPSVPAGLPVQDMWGLSDYQRPKPLLRRADRSTKGPLNYNGSGPAGSYQGSDFRKAYVWGSTLTGAGQTVAVGGDLADPREFAGRQPAHDGDGAPFHEAAGLGPVFLA